MRKNYILYKKLIKQYGGDGSKWDTSPINLENNPPKFKKINIDDCAMFYINLDRSINRKNFMEKQMHREGLNIIRFPAIDAKKINLDDYEKHLTYNKDSFFKINMKNHFTNNPKMIGHFGVYLSQLELMKEFLKTGKDYLIILEDDAVLCENFKQKLEERVELVPNDWEIILLGFQIAPNFSVARCKNINDNIQIKNGYLPLLYFVGCYGMLLTKNCVNKLLNLLIPMDWMIDHHISALSVQKKIKLYGLVHPIVSISGATIIKNNLFSYGYSSVFIKDIFDSTTNN